MRILAVDPGEKRIGLAISDPTETIATPLSVIAHVARKLDAAAILQAARDNGAGMIVIGQSVDDDGQPTLAGRRSVRMAEALRELTDLPITFWDEGFSTQDARAIRLQMGGSRKKRSGHLDDVAAAVILQSFLDSRSDKSFVG